jgi:NADH:ubiquinone reductase (H+-translocating)
MTTTAEAPRPAESSPPAPPANLQSMPNAAKIVRADGQPPEVVIIGGGFGGLSAAKALKHLNVHVTLLDRRNHHVFQPLLYQVATAGLSPGDIASPIRWILRRQRNVRVLLEEALSIDVANRRVLTPIGAIGYDYLIVATGSTHAYFGHDDWRSIAPGLKELDDALVLRRRMLLAFERAEASSDKVERRRLLTFVIVGGGPTGVELAGAVAEIARHALRHEFRTIDPGMARIILLEGGSDILVTFPRELREHAVRDLHALGVEVRLRALVTGMKPGLVQVGNEQVEAGTVFWAAGVQASPLGRSLGAPLDRAGRVIVQPDLTIPGHPEVFVVGDLAAYTHDGAVQLPGVAQVAMQQATHAAKMIARDLHVLPQPRIAFKYFNWGNLATIGRHKAIADFGWLRASGFIAWLMWLFIHILKLTGFRNRILVFTQWAWAYFSYQRSVRLITGDTGHDSC